MAAPKAEEGPSAVHDAAIEPVMIAMERAGDDGTWVATPGYGYEEYPASPHAAQVFGDAKPGSWARMIRMLNFQMACRIVDFKHDVKGFIQDFFNPNLDLVEQNRRQRALLEGLDERAHDKFWLLYDALDYGNEPTDDEEPGGLDVDGDGNPDRTVGNENDEEGLGLTHKSLSLVGFVDVRHMRRCIKAFFDPSMDVDGEDADRDFDTHVWAKFMSATGFVNRLWDLRRIIEVYFDTGLDLATRKRTMATMLGQLEEKLKARTAAVYMGRFKFL